METLGYKDQFFAKVEEGNFELEVYQSDSIIQGLLSNLEYTLNELEAQYKPYIKNQKEGYTMLKLNIQLFASKRGRFHSMDATPNQNV